MKSSTFTALNIQEPGAHLPHGVALLRLGFRPFYLVAAILAVTNVGIWAGVYLGALEWSLAMSPLLWHAHEMLMGFATAVIAGFLLTAGKAWTQRPTPRGGALGALVLLWLTARVCAVLGSPLLFMLADIALLPLVALLLLRLLVQSGNVRNYGIVGILLLLTAANVCFHLSALGLLAISPLSSLHAALALIVMLETVMGGRVIPGFTMSANPGLKIVPLPWLERCTHGLTAFGLLLWIAAWNTAWSGTALLFAALAHALRAWRWQPRRAARNPMLWILHAAYAWIALGLMLLGWQQLGAPFPASAGVHALAVGATGGLILGMITRTARGHTGRDIVASPLEVFAFGMLMVAAFARVVLPLMLPALLAWWIAAAALAWCLAFAAYLWRYAPWLLQSRVDGRDG